MMKLAGTADGTAGRGTWRVILLLAIAVASQGRSLAQQAPARFPPPAPRDGAMPATAPTSIQSAPAQTSGRTSVSPGGVIDDSAWLASQAGPKQSPPSHRANVQYTAGVLTIVADNSSLNQILRDVGRLTGMKITGGVAEERVYGNYGPADSSAVLVKLLSGTGSNMLLRQDSADAPVELVLTPRTGGASPPSPQQFSSGDDGEDLPPQRIVPVRNANGYPSPPPVQAPTPAGPQPGQQFGAPPPQPGEPGYVDPNTPAAANPATTNVQSPNGVKTPQEIYDQLMKLQQQKVAAPK